MMRVGVAIKSDDLNHLHGIFPQIRSHNGYTFPICDDGFRRPGKIQSNASLENYNDGKPRDFNGPREASMVYQSECFEKLMRS